ncbi:MAG: hypothetical protein AAGI68_03450 [Planctomycetota bacterium]
MHWLETEVKKHFPDFPGSMVGYEEGLDYSVFSDLGWHVYKQMKAGADGDFIIRFLQFVKWCEEQPRGETAEDDLYTAFVVSFLEHLFDHDETFPL